MKKRLFLLIVIAIVGFLFIAWWTRPTHRINRDSIAKIEPGMSKDEVEAIFNCPPGNYTTASFGIVGKGVDQKFLNDMNRLRGGFHHVWVGGEGGILVQFDNSNIALRFTFWEVESLGFAATLQRWIKRWGR